MRPLGEAGAPAVAGAKAFNLGRLIQAGFPVPAGWVIPAAEPLDEALRAQLGQLPAGQYAVRSSARLEDLGDLSFAGQYVTELGVAPGAVADAVARCRASVESESARAYLARSGLAPEPMAVIVQHMVQPVFAGVAFTVDPVTGADTQLVIEYTAGLGDSLVNGAVVPRTARYDWDQGTWLEVPERETTGTVPAVSGETTGTVPSVSPWLQKLARLCGEVQQLYGYPLDIEFAYDGTTVWLLQARAVTRIGHTGLADPWTTADFRDGGVSAEVCKPYMWSLYEYIWEHSLKDFLLTSHLIAPGRLRKLGQMFYGRPYWNLGVVKEVMARVPGYRERDFDLEFGIAPAYEGDGAVTRATPRSLVRLLPVALAQMRLLARRERTAADLADRLKATVERRLAELQQYAGTDPAESGPWIERAFVALTREDYLVSESTYFWQIFLNTIHQSLFKDSVRGVVSDSEYLELLCGLDDISHLRPAADLWRIGHSGLTGDALQEALAAHLARFGYHSDRELDVSYPNYWEQPDVVAGQLAELSRLDPTHDPAIGVAAQRAVFTRRMAALRAGRRPRAYAKLERKIERVRRLLWWREEFRDLSTMLYDVIRRYTVALADDLCRRGVLDTADDIWFTRVEDLWTYLEGGTVDLRGSVARQRRYYRAYRNYRSEPELVPAGGGAAEAVSQDGVLTGIGCSPGRVTGTARVIAGLDEIDRLRDGDILVTRYTDTGWTPKFAQLTGVVTEYGGRLCHSAIVSREYGIPCVVAVTGVLNRIRDGERITVDGGTGVVEVAP